MKKIIEISKKLKKKKETRNSQKNLLPDVRDNMASSLDRKSAICSSIFHAS